MWFFMISCYVLTGLSYIMLLGLGIQGLVVFKMLGVNHPAFALLTAIIYLFTETLVIFFFVGTGVSIKEYTQEHNTSPEYHKQSIAVKRSIYPPLLLDILLFMIVFILGGAVDTNKLPGYVHGLVYVLFIIHFTRTIVIQHRCFKDNTGIILAMSDVQSPPEGKQAAVQ